MFISFIGNKFQINQMSSSAIFLCEVPLIQRTAHQLNCIICSVHFDSVYSRSCAPENVLTTAPIISSVASDEYSLFKV